MKMPPLNEQERAVLLHKATEAPFSGAYTDCFENGIYLCRQCGTPLYESNAKFPSHCGWASFDDEIQGAIKHIPELFGTSHRIYALDCSYSYCILPS